MISEILDYDWMPFLLNHMSYMYATSKVYPDNHKIWTVFMERLRRVLHAVGNARSLLVPGLNLKYLCFPGFAIVPMEIFMILSCPCRLWKWKTDWNFFDDYLIYLKVHEHESMSFMWYKTIYVNIFNWCHIEVLYHVVYSTLKLTVLFRHGNSIWNLRRQKIQRMLYYTDCLC